MYLCDNIAWNGNHKIYENIIISYDTFNCILQDK